MPGYFGQALLLQPADSARVADALVAWIVRMHIDDWLDTPAKNDAEKWAKEFLEHCRRPAIDKDHAWLEANTLFCTYRGERWRVLGASRMGDVWLTKNFERVNGYDIRPDVDDCSEWAKMPNRQ